VGLIYLRKGFLDEGIALMEKGLQKCPWNPEWRQDLAKAYEVAGLPGKAADLLLKTPAEQKAEPNGD
jgi:hypothetical protein